MAFSELIKNFQRIRGYMQDFYVYGFKSREEFSEKSPRSYDNERRRIESYLGEHMRFRQTASGKKVFLSIDSRRTTENPLFKAWKAKTFTNGDITLHFILLDILQTPPYRFTLKELLERLDSEYLSEFDTPLLFEESTVRKKLQEYTRLGLLLAEKQGKTMYYARREATDLSSLTTCLCYFSETTPCGVLGSFLIDKYPCKKTPFAFKHHYITQTMDSEILYSLLDAIHEQRFISVTSLHPKKKEPSTQLLVPLKIFISVQNGRQYLLAASSESGRIFALRIDYILLTVTGEVCPYVAAAQNRLAGMQAHTWGVSTGTTGKLEHVEFTIRYDACEAHILPRLLREKRCGTVELLDDESAVFRADVFDSMELLPWIRTFICRITRIQFSNPEVERLFHEDLKRMYAIYRIGGDTDVIS